METVLANISGEVEQIKFLGEDYIVVPMTMIVEGVLNGSKGPYYYPESTIKNNPDAWNGMPIVLNHPQDSNGNYVSARYPDTLEKFGLGWVFNSTTSENRLTSKAYFNRNRLKQVRADLLQKLMNKEKEELSTGLFTAEIEENEGVYNSKKYVGVISSYTPDHLAILPDEKGACSLEDGCGINNSSVNNGDSILDAIKKLLGMKPKESKSLNQIQDELRELVKANHESYEYIWIADMYTDYFIYSNDQQYFKQGYTISEDGEVALSGSSTEVERKIVYNQEGDRSGSPQNSVSQESGESPMPLSKEDRAKLIDSIVGNCSCEKTKEPLFNDESKKTLESFTDSQLEALANKGKKEEGVEPKTTVVNTETTVEPAKELSDEEWLKSAPPGIRASIQNTLKRENEYKQTLVNQIKENENCRMTDELLLSKPIEELENLVEMLGVTNKAKEGETTSLGAGASPYGSIPNGQAKPKVLNQETRMKNPAALWAESNPSNLAKSK